MSKMKREGIDKITITDRSKEIDKQLLKNKREQEDLAHTQIKQMVKESQSPNRNSVTGSIQHRGSRDGSYKASRRSS